MDNHMLKLTQSGIGAWDEQLFNNVHIGVLIVDEKRIISKVNQTFCRLFGYSLPAEVPGQSVKILHVSDDDLPSKFCL